MQVDAVNHSSIMAPMSASTRDSIVKAAAQLLDEGGPSAVTFRAVGARVGLSHNAAFKLFRDKESLLAAIATDELRRQAAPPRRTRNRAERIGELRRRLVGYVRWARRYPERFKLTYGRWAHDYAGLGEAATTARGQLVDLVRQCQTDGTLPQGEPERVAAMLLSIAHGASSLALNGHLSREGKGKASPEDIIDDFLALIG
jgi:AcrR family transcriptional regulator